MSHAERQKEKAHLSNKSFETLHCLDEYDQLKLAPNNACSFNLSIFVAKALWL